MVERSESENTMAGMTKSGQRAGQKEGLVHRPFPVAIHIRMVFPVMNGLGRLNFSRPVSPLCNIPSPQVTSGAGLRPISVNLIIADSAQPW